MACGQGAWPRPSSEEYCQRIITRCNVGLVVEYYPATVETRVRFPDVADVRTALDGRHFCSSSGRFFLASFWGCGCLQLRWLRFGGREVAAWGAALALQTRSSSCRRMGLKRRRPRRPPSMRHFARGEVRGQAGQLLNSQAVNSRRHGCSPKADRLNRAVCGLRPANVQAALRIHSAALLLSRKKAAATPKQARPPPQPLLRQAQTVAVFSGRRARCTASKRIAGVSRPGAAAPRRLRHAPRPPHPCPSC